MNGSESRTSITQGDDRITPNNIRSNPRFDFNTKLDSTETFGLPSQHGSPIAQDNKSLRLAVYYDEMNSP